MEVKIACSWFLTKKFANLHTQLIYLEIQNLFYYDEYVETLI